jgi:hypothetical protein
MKKENQSWTVLQKTYGEVAPNVTLCDGQEFLFSFSPASGDRNQAGMSFIRTVIEVEEKEIIFKHDGDQARMSIGGFREVLGKVASSGFAFIDFDQAGRQAFKAILAKS